MKRREALKKSIFIGGATVGIPTLLSLLQSCQTEAQLAWSPKFLTQEEAKFVSDFVDVLLPKTDTPGALDVKVDVFIDRFYAEVLPKEAQADTRLQIEKFNKICAEEYGAVFSKLDPVKQKEVFVAEEQSNAKFNSRVWGTAVGKQEPVGFYRSLKSLALWAYFSSEEIGKNVLSYDPVPGVYKGCIPVADVGNTWSL